MHFSLKWKGEEGEVVRTQSLKCIPLPSLETHTIASHQRYLTETFGIEIEAFFCILKFNEKPDFIVWWRSHQPCRRSDTPGHRSAQYPLHSWRHQHVGRLQGQEAKEEEQKEQGEGGERHRRIGIQHNGHRPLLRLPRYDTKGTQSLNGSGNNRLYLFVCA